MILFSPYYSFFTSWYRASMGDSSFWLPSVSPLPEILPSSLPQWPLVHPRSGPLQPFPHGVIHRSFYPCGEHRFPDHFLAENHHSTECSSQLGELHRPVLHAVGPRSLDTSRLGLQTIPSGLFPATGLQRKLPAGHRPAPRCSISAASSTEKAQKALLAPLSRAI
jgi:hypothetical protein